MRVRRPPGRAPRTTPVAGHGAARILARGSILAVISAAALACQSPEAQRQRGGGVGGDVRNRAPVVEMHAGSRMYFETPCLLPEEECTGPRQASGLPGEFPVPR
jgi:hypothetical protein